MNNILNYFPIRIKELIEYEINNKNDNLEEIRIRVNRPIILKFNLVEKIMNYYITEDEILNILQLICENSIYSYQSQIAEGFITIKGGHRVGITGSCVVENGKVININYINSLNFRIARMVLGCSENILDHVLDFENNSVFNTLIVSPPNSGKTTILKDLIRQISSGIKKHKFKGMNVGIIDERGEIASLYKGNPQNDVGIKIDVLDNISKADGIKMLIRSMAPQVIVADEIGTIEDIDSINYAITSGCKGIFTAHGNELNDLYSSPIIKRIMVSNIFEVIIFLDKNEKGKIKDIYKLDKKVLEYKRFEERNNEPQDINIIFGDEV